MKSIELVIKYYKTSGLDIPKPIQELIDEITRLSPCEQEGYTKEIERLNNLLTGQRLMTEVKNIETERLKKKNEWLLQECISLYNAWQGVGTGDTYIPAQMQQALKDKP